MSRIILRRPSAISDLDDIADYIQNDSPDSAIRFLAAENAFSLLADSPELGTLCNFDASPLSKVRLWSIKNFRKYVIVYAPLEQGVEILRVLHGSRDFDAILSEES